MSEDGTDGQRGRVRRITAADVARVAGVSRVAVSRSFTPGASVSTAVRERVIATAQALGYRPNAFARQLNRDRSELVAFVAGFIDNYYYAVFFDRLLNELQTRGWRTLYVHVGAGGDAVEALAQASEYPVACTIVAAGSLDVDAIAAVRAMGPVILAGPASALPDADAVSSDGGRGMALVVDHLVGRGRCRLACISGPAGLASARERADAFGTALAGHGLAPAGIVHTDFTEPGGVDGMRRLLAMPVPPDAVVCGNDAIAFGVLNLLRAETALAVPHDIAVTGFDDTAPAAWPLIGLTTVASPLDRRIAAICDLLDRRVADPSAPAQRIRIEPHLVVRATS